MKLLLLHTCMDVRVKLMASNKQRGTGIENGSKRSNGTAIFDRTNPTEKSGPPQRLTHFFIYKTSAKDPVFLISIVLFLHNKI